MTVLKIMDFQENDLFQENEQNEQILSNFKERVLYRSVSFIEKLWILRKLANLSDLTEITHSSEFSKESLIPFAVSSQKIAHFQ